MAMLHTVNKSPFEKNSLRSCLNIAKQGSAVLLIEDGVYAATRGTVVSDQVSEAAGNGISVYALGPDMSARGVSEDQLIDGVQVVDYAGFVRLATEHDNVQAWL